MAVHGKLQDLIVLRVLANLNVFRDLYPLSFADETDEE